MQTVDELFEAAIGLEHSMAQLYQRFADHFSHHPQVASFWRRYADEEHGHAVYLEHIRSGMPPQGLSALPDATIARRVRACQTTMAAELRAPIVTLEQAYQLAIELENSETNAVFEFMIMNFSTGDLSKSHKFLRNQLSSHISHLTTHFPQEYRNSVVRQRVDALPLEDRGQTASGA